MSIEAFVGSIGGGKSCSCVRRMLAYMGHGGRCASNILLEGYDPVSCTFAADSPVLVYLRINFLWEYQEGQFIYIPFEDMVEKATWFMKVPGGQSRSLRTLLVVDEATDLFDNLDRDKARSDSGFRELLRFLRLCRHVHVDVIFICQDIAAINSRLRGLVTGFWRSVDLANFRFAKLGFLKLPFDRFLVQRFDKTGKTEQERLWLKKDLSVFACYKSEAFQNDINIRFDGVVIDPEKARIQQQKKGVKMWVKVLAIASSLILGVMIPVGCTSYNEVCLRLDSLNSALDSIPSASASVGSVKRSGSEPDTKPEYQVFRGPIRLGSAGGNRWAIFRGCRYDIGMPSEFGIVEDISKNPASIWVRCDQNGRKVFLFEGEAPQQDWRLAEPAS